MGRAFARGGIASQSEPPHPHPLTAGARELHEQLALHNLCRAVAAEVSPGMRRPLWQNARVLITFDGRSIARRRWRRREEKPVSR